MRCVGLLGCDVIERVYPQRLTELPDTPPQPARGLCGQPTGTIPNPRDGVVLAFDIPGLVSMAERADYVIEMVPQVGDFVAAQDPLFRIFDAGVTIPGEALCRSVALGQERTMEFFQTHKVSQKTFQAALDQFGAQHLTELTTLMGSYAQTAFILNAFDVQFPEQRTEPLLPVS